MAIGAAIALAGIAASLYSSHKQQQAAKNAQNQMNPLVQAQAKNAQELYPWIGKYLGAGWNAYQAPLGYYSALAGGDHEKMLAALSPELNSIGQKYQTIMRTSREFAPRSGASATYNADLAYREGDEKQALINSQRSDAMRMLYGAGGQLTNAGLSAAGQASTVGNNAMNGVIGQYNLGRQSAADQSSSYADIAKAIGGMYSDYKDGSYPWLSGQH